MISGMSLSKLRAQHLVLLQGTMAQGSIQGDGGSRGQPARTIGRIAKYTPCSL